MGFQAGFDKGVFFRPDGQGNVAVLNITGHSWSEQIDKLDVTHSGTAGLQALLAGILRGDGNVKANLDTSNLPWLSTLPNIKAGVNGQLSFQLGTAAPYVVPCLITKIHFQSAVEGKVEYDFDVSLNCLAASVDGKTLSAPNRPVA